MHSNLNIESNFKTEKNKYNLKIKTNFEYKNRENKISNLIFKVLYHKNNYFFSLLGILLYYKIYNRKFKLTNYQRKKIKNTHINNKNNLDFFNYMFVKINNIIKNKIKFSKNNIILNKRHNINNSDCEIFDQDKKIYKSIKNYTIIYKDHNFLIKQYQITDIYDNFPIVSIINEILLQIYSYFLLIHYKNSKYFEIPEIYSVYLSKDSNFDEINIIMKYINLENNIFRNLENNEIKIYYRIKHFFLYLQKNNVYHNDTHNNNLIILDEKIILLDFGKATLFNAFNSSNTGFPKLKKLQIYNEKTKLYIIIYIKNLIKKYQRLINFSNSNDLKYFFNIF